jgi:hypothetical protein
MGSASPLSRLASLFTTRRPVLTPPPPLEVNRFRSKAEFEQFQKDHREELDQAFRSECALFEKQEPFTINCFCYLCGKPGPFHVDFSLAREMGGHIVPAWRESVVCPRCHLSNRQRASAHLLETEARIEQGEPLYLTEQVSGLYKVMSKRHKPTEGSEYFGPKVERGKKDERGIRNEDITKLTFPDASFAAVMCFEVLEHVPDYRAGLSEISRVIRPGGKLVMTVPFNPRLQEHLVRASLREDGTIEHHTEPEYHVDPLSAAGCLCFYHFGWQILDELRSLGFADAYVVRHPSREYGYLGPDPLQFIALKAN